MRPVNSTPSASSESQSTWHLGAHRCRSLRAAAIGADELAAMPAEQRIAKLRSIADGLQSRGARLAAQIILATPLTLAFSLFGNR
jgi:acyl-CoA reductase-like NAD-dependent aldehyde dehydrogenase